MVYKRHGKCILSCDNKKCINESTETFKDVICPYHLSQVFGLRVDVQKFEKESMDYYVGPFLTVDESFSFEPNTVVFPERDFVDQFINMSETTSDQFYKYKMNPRMGNYLQNLAANSFNFSDSEVRYQIEVIRNLFFVYDPNKKNENNVPKNISEQVNLAQDSENSNKELLRTLQSRFQGLNTTIQTEDYNKIFKDMSVLDVGANSTVSVTIFTPFMNFIIFNCLTDEHKLPVTEADAIGITCYLNLLYKSGVGFVTTQELLNPSHLVIGGITKGNNNYYQLKVRPITKRTVQNTTMYKSNLADNVRSSNILNPQQDFCWTKR